MTMTVEQLAQLREVAERPKEYGGISRYTKAMVARIDFSEAFTPAVVLALLDELERKDKRIAELEARTVTVRLPAHKYRECVNGLLEEAIAYAGTQQLRERLSSRLANFVQPDHPHTRCAAGINLTVED